LSKLGVQKRDRERLKWVPLQLRGIRRGAKEVAGEHQTRGDIETSGTFGRREPSGTYFGRTQFESQGQGARGNTQNEPVFDHKNPEFAVPKRRIEQKKRGEIRMWGGRDSALQKGKRVKIEGERKDVGTLQKQLKFGGNVGEERQKVFITTIRERGGINQVTNSVQS